MDDLPPLIGISPQHTATVLGPGRGGSCLFPFVYSYGLPFFGIHQNTRNGLTTLRIMATGVRSVLPKFWV